MRAFNHIAIDAGGPFTIKVLRSTQKCWLLVFVCLTYKAVHLEVIYDVSGQSFLMAFQRFVARRGRPSTVMSDNGTNFVLGERMIAKTWESIYGDISADLQAKYPQIVWTFTPPFGPHFNGMYERMVRSAKPALQAVLPPGLIDSEQFHTGVVMAEGILNGRPLCYVSTDAEELQVLCPNNFIVGRAAADLLPVATAEWKLTKKMAFIDTLMQEFWNRFLKEMVPQMHLMNKWTRPSRNLQEGDIVVVLDSLRRGNWPLARIVAVKAGGDGKVREATIFMEGKPYQRPLSRLMLLVSNDEWDPHQ